jgi:hypothetical protein
LTPGHPVIEIVGADDVDINISSRTVNKVITSDCCKVAISAEHGDHEFWVSEFETNCEGDRATVGGVVGVDIHIASDSP